MKSLNMILSDTSKITNYFNKHKIKEKSLFRFYIPRLMGSSFQHENQAIFTLEILDETDPNY